MDPPWLEINAAMFLFVGRQQCFPIFFYGRTSQIFFSSFFFATCARKNMVLSGVARPIEIRRVFFIPALVPAKSAFEIQEIVTE